MWTSDEEMAMKKIDRMIDNITTLFVFVMTFAVSFILSLAQSSETNLRGENLLIFLLGFWGSVICIAIRYVFLYRKAIAQNNIMKKILMFLYLILGNSIFLLILAGTLIISDFSIEEK